jgi:AcrR family transcriptional regulator
MAFGEPNRDRRAERQEATRREILDAAWRVARTNGLAGLTLRDVAAAVGLRPPSLYSYFPSKDAIYDGMFADGYRQLLDLRVDLPRPRTVEEFRVGTRRWFAFAVEDPVRYQLLFQRTIPGFEPSEASMDLADAALGWAAEALAAIRITTPEALDLFTAVLSGLAAQQLANDPGGDRWARLLDEAVDMFLTHARRRRKR